MTTRSPARLAPWLLLGTLGALLWAERRWPLRKRTAPQAGRLAYNALTGAGAAAAVALLEAPLTRRLARTLEPRRWGLTAWPARLPRAARSVVSLLLLDASLTAWHVLLHRSPLLWRWHRVHHADADLDVSTALRFHAAEMLWSLPWRLAQVALIGVQRRTLDLWSTLTAAAVLFHHANLRLPPRAERALGWFVVTPRLHGIHHADVQQLQQTNFSSGLTLWDRLLGTFCDDEPQRSVTIGLPR